MSAVTLPKRAAPLARHISNATEAPKMRLTEEQLGKLMAEEALRARGGRGLPVRDIYAEGKRGKGQVDARQMLVIDCLDDWMTQKQVAAAVGFPRSTVDGDLGCLVADGRVERELRRNPETGRLISIYRRKRT